MAELVNLNDLIDWEKVPEGYNYAAQDESGKIYIYERQPTLTNGFWHDGGDITTAPLLVDQEGAVRRPLSTTNKCVVLEIWVPLSELDIPDWATYLALDADGDLYAYENEPVWSEAFDGYDNADDDDMSERLKFSWGQHPPLDLYAD